MIKEKIRVFQYALEWRKGAIIEFYTKRGNSIVENRRVSLNFKDLEMWL